MAEFDNWINGIYFIVLIFNVRNIFIRKEVVLPKKLSKMKDVKHDSLNMSTMK